MQQVNDFESVKILLLNRGLLGFFLAFEKILSIVTLQSHSKDSIVYVVAVNCSISKTAAANKLASMRRSLQICHVEMVSRLVNDKKVVRCRPSCELEQP